MEKAIEIASNTLTLKWYEIILARVVKSTSETLSSLDKYGVDYLLKLYEYLTYEDYIEALHVRDTRIKKEQAKQAKTLGDFLKKQG